MLVVDANVLLHAVNEDSRQHRAARDWLDTALNGAEDIGFADLAILAFLRIATRAGVFPRPLPLEDACRVVDGWLGAPAAIRVHTADDQFRRVCGLLASAGTAGNLVSDAHLAALAIAHDATLVTFDRDVGRFAALSVRLLDAR